jgi:hypothetical protein
MPPTTVKAVRLTQVDSCGGRGGAGSAKVTSPFENFVCPTRLGENARVRLLGLTLPRHIAYIER